MPCRTLLFHVPLTLLPLLVRLSSIARDSSPIVAASSPTRCLSDERGSGASADSAQGSCNWGRDFQLTAMCNPLVSEFIDKMNADYEAKHLAYENDFWSTKMGLEGASNEHLAATKSAYDSFLADAANLKAVREQLQAEGLSEEQEKILKIMEKTFASYMTEDPKASAIKEKINSIEAKLAHDRNNMSLGYTDPETKQFVKASSVLLRDTMRTSSSEEKRRACYEGLRSIGPFVVETFCEIVKLRNQAARAQGYEDYYDYKVTTTEGFGKTRLFEILGGLEEKTRPLMAEARKNLAKELGESALQPWNTGYMMAGDVEKKMDKYFPFENAVDVWARSFAAMGINYMGGKMVMDLCDRDGKYSNGFCHWPQPAWKRPDGTWVPATAQLTSLAMPSSIGSGKTALVTLMHEGGHAAHFANIVQGSPFFSQERAPTSVSYAENQSMFLDSLVGDAAWLARYALDRDGNPIPWEIIEEKIRATHPYAVAQLRALITIPFFEKALYELPEDGVTPEAVLALADKVEQDINGGFIGRPTMSVPHFLADESSAYYHGYVLAEMSVHQTRQHFLNKYRCIVDNPAVGKDLTDVYWRPGNAANFLDLVEELTGEPLTANAWVQKLHQPMDALIRKEAEDYKDSISKGPTIPAGGEVDIAATVRLVHGDFVVGDTDTDGSFESACRKFKAWVRSTFYEGA